MTQEWQWSLETYTLNRVKEIFGLPCVIRIKEGYMSDDESEEFAQGDIMAIDTELVSDKVAAIFTRYNTPQVEKRPGIRVPDYGIITPNQPEVFLPYGYDGKLKVLKPVTEVNGVKELSEVFPRFATLKENLHVKTNHGESVKISKGSKIELDRILPGSTYGTDSEDKLVIQFCTKSGEKKIAPLSMTGKGKFRTEEDHTEYTMNEAIDRYGLPLDVKFSSDEIKRIFDQEVSEGRRPNTKPTRTLRLNRIVKQHVLIGHYKPVSEDIDTGEDKDDKNSSNDGAGPDAGDIRRRTVIVLPVDNPDIGNIEVNIFDGDVLTIYEKLVNIQSLTEAKDMVRDTLCVDFSVKPGVKMIAETSRKYANVSHGKLAEEYASRPSTETSTSGEPPPLPRRPAHPHRIKEAEASDESWQKKINFAYKPPPSSPHKQVPNPGGPASERDLDGYEIPVTGPYLDMSGDNSGARPPVLPRRPQHTPSTSGPRKMEKGKKQPKGKLWPSIKSPFKTHTKDIHVPEKMAPLPPLPRVSEHPDPDDNLDGYEELVDIKRFGDAKQDSPSPRALGASSSTTDSINPLGDYEDILGTQQTAVVRPIATESAIPRDDVNEGYEEIDNVIALRKQAETSERREGAGARKQIEVTGAQAQTETAYVTEKTLPDRTDTSHAASKRQEPKTSPSMSNETRQTHKLFLDLTNEELVERLKLCNIPDLAETCKSENLDGSFFADATIEFMKDTMGLQGLKLAKFLKMKDENWVPK